MKKIFLIQSLLLIFIISAFSQKAVLKGTVKDEKGEPIFSANVIIDASIGLATATDFDGNYKINLDAGKYTVKYKYIGMQEQSVAVSLNAGEEKVINITLKEKEEIMNTVVISASKYEKKLSEETVSLEVMKSNVLSNQNVTDVQNGVQKVPGVTIADGQANIRGGSGWSYGAGSRVAVLFDDLPLTTADADDAKWSMMPVENIEQIEVLKGAASAIYGSGALNGVINTRMAYPTDKPFTKLTTYMGFYDSPTKTKEMKWWNGRPQYTAGYNFADRRKVGQWDIVLGNAYNNDRGYLDSSDYQDARLNAKIRYRFKNVPGLNAGVNVLGYWSWGKTFFIWDSIGSKSYRPLAGTITQYENNRYIVDPFINYTYKDVNKFALKYRWLNSSNINSTGQGSIANRHIIDFNYQRPFNVSENLKMNFLAGAGGRIDKIAPPGSDTSYLYGNRPHNAYNASLFAQIDAKIIKKLNVTLGARWEYFDVDGRNSLKDLTYPLFRLGLNYQAATATFIRGSFGQGFRYPSIAEFYVTTNLGPLAIYPNEKLRPEKGYSAEVGVKQGYKIGKSGNVTGYADAAVFFNQYTNMMEFMFGQFGDITDPGFGAGFSSQNIGNTRIIGTDISAAIQATVGEFKFTGLIGYTYINTKVQNWDKPLLIFNKNGDTLRPSFQSAYNNANAPANIDTTSQITYGMLSSSSNNELKYRPNHQVKIIAGVEHKKFDFNIDYQFISYQKNIDYAFVSPFFAETIPAFFGVNSFKGLREYRGRQEANNYAGDHILNMAVGYKPIEKLKIAFIVKNVMNWEWMPRPGRFEAPRSYTLQLTYQFF
jgi:iron complex outermembrane receptor protein